MRLIYLITFLLIFVSTLSLGQQSNDTAASERVLSKYTYKVTTSIPNSAKQFAATAFLTKINGKPVLVTAAHVCDQPKADYIVSVGGFDYFSQKIAASDKIDVCFLAISKRINTDKSLELSTNAISGGELAAAFGYPASGRFSGHLVIPELRMDYQLGDIKYKGFAAAGGVYEGMSGGPLFSPLTGRVIGVVSGTGGTISYFADTVDVIAEFKRLVGNRSTDVQL